MEVLPLMIASGLVGVLTNAIPVQTGATPLHGEIRLSPLLYAAFVVSAASLSKLGPVPLAHVGKFIVTKFRRGNTFRPILRIHCSL